MSDDAFIFQTLIYLALHVQCHHYVIISEQENETVFFPQLFRHVWMVCKKKKTSLIEFQYDHVKRNSRPMWCNLICNIEDNWDLILIISFFSASMRCNITPKICRSWEDHLSFWISHPSCSYLSLSLLSVGVSPWLQMAKFFDKRETSTN